MMHGVMVGILAQAPPVTAERISQGDDATFWMPPRGSTTAGDTDIVFYFIYWVSVFFFVLIVALMTYFLLRYRRKHPGQPAAGGAIHNTALELTWTIIPLVLVLVMFYLGFKGFMDISRPPGDSLDVYVNARKWSWSFTYPNGHVDSELHVPVNRPVRLILASADVIHSFFIPAFRVKRDAVPGRYNTMWFEATEATPEDRPHIALCAEYCGTDHSNMWAKVFVHEPGLYEQWLEKAADPFTDEQGQPVPLADVGQLLYRKFSCNTCHTIDGSPHTGPTFLNLYGKQEQMTGGETIVADEEYIRESILEPQARIVSGYDGVMPTYKGQIKDREIMAVIEYLKTLSNQTSAEPSK